MHILVPFIITALVGSAALVAVFAWLAREHRAPWLRLWLLSFVAATVRYAFALVGAAQPGVFAFFALHQLATASSAVFLLVGVASFVGRKAPVAGVVAVGLGFLWSLFARATGLSFPLTTAPLFFALGVITLYAGVVILRANEARSIGRTIAGVSLLAHGLHRFDYPFLRDIEWIAPWGFLVAALCELSVGVGFVVGAFERTRSEARVSDERYREFFDRSPAAFFRADVEGRLVDANPALLRLLGCASVDEARALPATHMDLLALARPPSDVDDEVRRALREHEHEWRARDGAPLLVTGAGRAVRDDDGQISFYEGFVRDVTLERRLDAQLKHAQRSEVVGRLAGGIAHDFNNLLTVIAGNVALLRDHVGPERKPSDRPDESGQLLDEIADATEQANALTRQMLALAKKTPFTRAPIDLGELVARNRAVLKRLVGKGVKLVVDTERAARVVANAGHLDQVLLNLVINARDAITDEGTITVATSVDDARGEVALRVSDTGVGMTPDIVEHIFEPFFTTKDAGHGTGLGLPVVESVVTQLGGTISVDSTPGEGTTFTVRFPLAPADARAEGQEPARREEPPGALRLLFVDDDAAIARVVERGLTQKGVSVTTCERASAALERLSKGERYDVIASDVTMPEMDGIAFARAVRARFPGVPVLLMSGYAERAHELAELGVGPVLEKPFTAETFLAALKGALSR